MTTGLRPLADEQPRREPSGSEVALLQAELGIREAPDVDEYGPTSALSEELLLRGYGLEDPS